MSPANTFFDQKQVWSRFKDDVLRTYLQPYLAKLSRFEDPIRIADCFAGQGRFDDGEPGSPLIICDAISQQHNRPDNKATDIKGVFIEKDHTEALTNNLPDEPWVHVLDGEYETRIKNFLENYQASGKHLFLYVDPFGIKSIRFDYFEKVMTKDFRTVELLLNLNAFGFLREGCRLLGWELKNEDEEPLEYAPDVNSPLRLDEIAGGDYWRQIVTDYYNGRTSMALAEERFVTCYCDRLSRVFKHVLNTPIKANLGHIPKYRIVFGTNHEDGLLLMADNMSKRWAEFRNQAREDEQYLFEVDFPDPSKLCDCFDFDRCIPSLIEGEEDLKAFLVKLVKHYGISYPLSCYTDYLKELEGKVIDVRREPDETPTGRPRKGWAHNNKDYNVYISRKSEWQQSLL